MKEFTLPDSFSNVVSGFMVLKLQYGDQWWNISVYKVHLLKHCTYNFEALLLNLSIYKVCYFILLFHYIYLTAVSNVSNFADSYITYKINKLLKCDAIFSTTSECMKLLLASPRTTATLKCCLRSNTSVIMIQ